MGLVRGLAEDPTEAAQPSELGPTLDAAAAGVAPSVDLRTASANLCAMRPAVERRHSGCSRTLRWELLARELDRSHCDIIGAQEVREVEAFFSLSRCAHDGGLGFSSRRLGLRLGHTSRWARAPDSQAFGGGPRLLRCGGLGAFFACGAGAVVGHGPTVTSLPAVVAE